MTNQKNVYWKVVDSEYPGGMFFESRRNALEWASNIRDDGFSKAYTRRVILTDEEVENLNKDE